MWTAVMSNSSPFLVEGPLRGCLFHNMCTQAFWSSSGLLASPTHAVRSVLSPAPLWVHFMCEAAELHPTLEAQLILLLCLVG